MRRIALLFLTVILTSALYAQVIEKTYTFNDPKIEELEGDFQMIKFDNTLQTGLASEPTLPYRAVSLLLPAGTEAADIEITLEEKTELPGNFTLYPRQPSQPLSKKEATPFVKNESLYQSNISYPEKASGKLSTGFMNGYSIASSAFTPVVYNPAEGSLAYYKKVTIRISTARSEKSTTALKNINSSAGVLYRVKRAVQNTGMLGLYPEKRFNGNGYDMMIIVTEQFESEFEPLIEHYADFGLVTEAVTLEYINNNISGDDPQEKMRNYIIQEYQENGVEHVLLAGDVEHIPYRGFYCMVESSSIYEDDDIPSDLYFSALDGTWNDDGDNLWGEIGEDDLYPEVSVGRLSFSNSSELSAMLNKTMMYQTSPVEGELRDPVLAGEHLWSDPLTYGSDYLELLIGFHDDNGYETTGMPEDYDFLKLYESTGNWSGNDLIAAINQGKQFVHHSGHANEWSVMKLSSGDITNGNFSGANGVDHNFTNVYTHGCLCGAFDSQDCIAEKMVSIENLAAAFVGNSRYGWFNEGQTEGPSAHLHREFVDALYDDKLDRIGMAHAESRTATAPWVNAPGQWEEGALRWCFYCCNVLGDPAMAVWTDEPYDFQASYQETLPIGVPTLEVTVTKDGEPLENYNCVLKKDGTIHGMATTDETGYAQITMDPPIQELGDAELVISGYNGLPTTFPVLIVPNDNPYVIYGSHDVNDEAGNNDGMVDYGESILLDMTMENVGSQPAEGVLVTMTTEDEFITITDNSEDFGAFDPETAKTIEDAFAFDVTNNIPDNHLINFTLTATDGAEEWTSTFTITAHAPVLAYDDYTIDDSQGNGNGKLDPGETTEFTLEIANNGSSAAYEVMAELTTNDQYISVESDPQEIGEIMAGESGMAAFTVTADDETPMGHLTSFNVGITAQGGLEAEGSFSIVVGQIPVVIIDLDGNASSGPDMESVIENLGVSTEYMTSFPDDMNLYSSAFVCLGIYGFSSGNHVLTSSEGQILADYLDNGGNLYMEGGDTWYYDEQTAVHGMFSISGVSDGGSDLGTILGIDGTFAEGMSFNYNGDNNWIDHIEPEGNAFKILENQSPNYGTGVAYDEGDYKTIGTSHEFGGLGEAEDLMMEYLKFFGLYSEEPIADFEADVTGVEQGGEVNFTDLSQGNPTSWQWTFEGGTPATSTDPNPTVAYNQGGCFDVTLTVSNNAGTDTKTVEDYIEVMPTEMHFDFEGGNPADPVYTMYLSTATLEGADLEFGDEIAIFDGETMVGQFMLEEVLTPGEQFDHALIAFSTVVSGNGYDPGNPIILKCWDVSEQVETGTYTIEFQDPYGDAWTEEYFPEGDGEFSIVDLMFETGGSQQMMLTSGFQFISSHMEPTNPDLMNLCEDLMYDETLDFIRNSEGNMLQKIGPNWVNNIGEWNTMEGYLFKMYEDDDFMMEGSVMDPTTPMTLEAGYKFISYLPAGPMDAEVAMETVLDNLDFMRNSEGNMLQKIGPNWVNNIGDMTPGEGYLVKMNAADELVYAASGTKSNIVRAAAPSFYNFNGGNPADPVYTMYLETGNGIEAGDEVAAYQDGKLLGATTLIEGAATQNDLALFSTLTEGKGYKAGKAIELRLYDQSENQQYKLNAELDNPYGDAHISMAAPAGDGQYSIAKVTKSTTGIGDSEGSFTLYPNPANEVVNITAGSAIERISVYDYTGKLVMETAPASNTTDLDVSNYESGIYLIRIETATATINKQVVVR